MSDNAIIESLAIIEQRILLKLQAEDLASSVFMSKYHYQRLFHEIMGESVMGYVKKRKLSLAGRELIETDNTILDIAFKFGYGSHESFTRAFKSYMGVTPTEYRKYGLSSISQKKYEKERTYMNSRYEKNTNEIIRDFHEFIAQARETSEYALKNGTAHYAGFWNIIAARTNDFADKLSESLTQITAVSDRPDQISNRFGIIKIMEDTAFHTYLLAFHVNLFVSRGTQEDREDQEQICLKYKALAQSSGVKVNQISKIFSELAAFIVEDMKKTAIEKIDRAVQLGRDAVDHITGFDYIKEEVNSIVNELSGLKYEELSASKLEDYIFMLDIISFTASIDAVRNPDDKSNFDSLQIFSRDLAEVQDFISNLVKPEESQPQQRELDKHLMDITFHGNILLFYTKGEISESKLGRLLSEGQKERFGIITAKFNGFIKHVVEIYGHADGKEALESTIPALTEIFGLLMEEGRELGEKGGSICFLADEVRSFTEGIRAIIRKV